MKILKTISRNVKAPNGKPALYVAKSGQFGLNKKAAAEFMLNEKNAQDYGFLFHLNTFGEVYIERVLLHNRNEAFPISVRNGSFRFFSSSALKFFPNGFLNFGENKSVLLDIDFGKPVTVENRLMYPITPRK